jgi:hypothetical protein
MAGCQPERLKVHPHTAEGMFGRSREPCMRQCLLGGEARRGIGIGEGTGKALGCGVGYQGLAVRSVRSRKLQRSQTLPSSDSLFLYLS